MVQILNGIYKYRKLYVAKKDTRPTLSSLRKTIFDILREEVEDSVVLDLFAGAGSLGFEALSRGAKRAIFVENSKAAAAVIRKNIALLEADDISELIVQEASLAIQRLSKQAVVVNLIFADPPYGQGLGLATIHQLDTLPLLASGGSLFIEERWQKGENSEPPLKTLHLESMRKRGKTSLMHYRKL